MIYEIQAKSLLQKTKSPSSWFNVYYNMNIYRGCQHGCIYCDSRSDCYRIENFDTDVSVKINALEILKKELPKKDNQLTIGTGAMCDPYMPTEKRYNLTKGALELIAEHKFPLHLITKSDLVLRDKELLKEINNNKIATVAFTVTTADDCLAKIVEPKAPIPSKRFEALNALSEEGINVGVTLMPVLPFIEDSEESIAEIVNLAKKNGAKFIIAYFGMTIRNGQREYFYSKLDEHFSGMKDKYIKTFKNSYNCDTLNHKKLYALLFKLCRDKNIACSMKDITYYNPKKEQLSLF